MTFTKCQMFYVVHLIQFSQQSIIEGGIVMSILQVGKLRLREGNDLPKEGHPACQWLGQLGSHLRFVRQLPLLSSSCLPRGNSVITQRALGTPLREGHSHGWSIPGARFCAPSLWQQRHMPASQ